MDKSKLLFIVFLNLLLLSLLIKPVLGNIICIDGHWMIPAGGEEKFCDNPDYSVYTDKYGIEHCADLSFSSLTDGTWCEDTFFKFECINGNWKLTSLINECTIYENEYIIYENEYIDSRGLSHCVSPSEVEENWCTLKNSCGDSICNIAIENCNNCQQDCGCKEDEACHEDSLDNKPLYYCQIYIDLNELKKSKEISLDLLEPFKHSLSIKNKDKIYNWGFEQLWKNGTSIWYNGNNLDLYGGETITLGLENLSKDGKDLSVKLIDRQGDTIKLLFSKPSESQTIEPPLNKLKTIFNNEQYRYYGMSILWALLIILIFTGVFYIRRKKNTNKGYKISEPREQIIEKEIKEKISSNITEAITVDRLGVKRGSNTILENINFVVRRGEFVSLLGPSGSGKSTIIEILAGRRKPSSGRIKIFGKNFDEKGINEYIGFVPQGNEIYFNQTVLKNLENSVIKWGIKNSEQKIFDVLEQVNLNERKNLIAGKLSGGQQKLLSLAMELIREPELLILDEPTTGLDPNTRNQIITILCNLSKYNKKTILITTHFMDDAEECDEVVIINNKKVVAIGSPERLKKMLPGSGKMVTLVLENSDKDLLEKIKRTKGIERVITEGRTLNILTMNPNAIEIANKVHEYGGYVNESKISKATMKEVFVFFTGKSPEE